MKLLRLNDFELDIIDVFEEFLSESRQIYIFILLPTMSLCHPEEKLKFWLFF